MTTIVFRKTTTKPADVDWWFKIEPEKSAVMNKFINEYPGISVRNTTTVDANNIITIIEFNSYEDFGKYMVDIHALPEWNSRATYIKANAIIETMSLTTTD